MIFLVLTGLLVACGGGSASTPPVVVPANSVSKAPSNEITYAIFRDQDSAVGKLAGTVVVNAPEIVSSDNDRVQSIWLYWADEQGNKQGEPWLKTAANKVYQINIAAGTDIPENTHSFLLYPANDIGEASQGSLVPFHDFSGNAALSGPGGNENQSWYYGDDRPNIAVRRTEEQGGLCVFDNGLVSVTDMQNSRDVNWDANSANGLPNNTSDSAFPPYAFLCGISPVHNADNITDEVGIWTYSTLNDSMYYGVIVYDTFLKYLGEPPLEEKIRLRVHYGDLYGQDAYWDGAYANFSDAYLSSYSMASLDSIAHEVGHGVLNRISSLGFFNQEISADARTLHEAFGDISGVMAKYEFSQNFNIWLHGDESQGQTRKLDQIKTEEKAIDSFLDYEEAGDNFYLRIGMITYPFYLLSNKWGIEPTYSVFIAAARHCWMPTTTLTEAAECIKNQASFAGLAEADVIDAFKAVKIKLFTEGVLSHFTADRFKLRTEFSDDSQSTNQVVQWLWDFGDGQTSSQPNPQHTFPESGDYTVSLSITDQLDNQDTFERIISVTEQYCPIKLDKGASNQFTLVIVGGTEINFNPTESDYTHTPINITNPANTTIEIQGNTDTTERSTTWRIWIDLNDNGVFGDQNQELILDILVPEGQPFNLKSVLDLSELAYDGNPKYMRIKGDYAKISPCSLRVGEALDLRIQW